MTLAHAIQVSALAMLLTVGSAYADRTPLELDKARSNIFVVTRPGGLFGFFGSKHAILVSRWFVTIRYDDRDVLKSNVDADIPADGLEIDSEEARKVAGLSAGAPSSEDTKKLQLKLFDQDALDIRTYPVIRFSSTSIEKAEKEALLVKGTLTLRGASHEVAIPVSFSKAENQTFHFQGFFEIKQSDYGIHPLSTGGLAKTRDAIEIHFDLYTKPPRFFAHREKNKILDYLASLF